MAIDPMLYEKVSGRKGDPYSRMGEALAQSDAAKSQREARKADLAASRLGTGWGYYKYKMIAGAVVVVLVGIVILVKKLFS